MTPNLPDPVITNLRVLLETYAGGELPEFATVDATAEVFELPAGVEVPAEPGFYFVHSGLVGMQIVVPGKPPQWGAIFDESALFVGPAVLRHTTLPKAAERRVEPRAEVLPRMVERDWQLKFITMEPSLLVGYDFSQVLQLVARHRAWSVALANELASTTLALTEMNIRQRMFSAEERYTMFMTERPRLAARMRQRDIASFVGISETGLSRILGKMRGRHPAEDTPVSAD